VQSTPTTAGMPPGHESGRTALHCVTFRRATEARKSTLEHTRTDRIMLISTPSLAYAASSRRSPPRSRRDCVRPYARSVLHRPPPASIRTPRSDNNREGQLRPRAQRHPRETGEWSATTPPVLAPRRLPRCRFDTRRLPPLPPPQRHCPPALVSAVGAHPPGFPLRLTPTPLSLSSLPISHSTHPRSTLRNIWLQAGGLYVRLQSATPSLPTNR